MEKAQHTRCCPKIGRWRPQDAQPTKKFPEEAIGSADNGDISDANGWLAGAALFGLGISVLQDLSSDGGNALMIFSRIYGSSKLPSLEKSAIFLLVGGLIIIVYGIVSMVAICRKTYKYLCLKCQRGLSYLPQGSGAFARAPAPDARLPLPASGDWVAQLSAQQSRLPVTSPTIPPPFQYVALMVLCIALEASAGVYIVKFQKEINVVFRRFLEWTIAKRYQGLWNVRDVYSIAWDVAQMKQRCCGVGNGTDWESAGAWNRTVLADRSDGSKVWVTLRVPYTCCKLLDRDSLEIDWLSSIALARLVVVGAPVLFDQPCLHEPNEHNSYISTGCYDKLYGYVLKYNSAVLLAATAVIIAELVTMVIVICLYKLSVKNALMERSDRVANRNDVVLRKYAYQQDDTAALTTRI